MIERKNVVDLLGDRSGIYHSAVLTCYSFDPIFFESVYLPVLRNLGINNIVVLMESSVYDQLLSDPSYVAHKVNAGHYTLVRQNNVARGVFHTKLTLLFGTKEAAMVLGSGNLTFSGMSLNEEVWNVFHVKNEKSPHFGMIRKAWDYVKLLAQDVAFLPKRQLQWMQEHTPWLQLAYADEPTVLKNGEIARLLYNHKNGTIIEQLYAAIGEEIIKEICVVSPFFDADGRFLQELESHFQPEKFRCVLDKNRQSAPYSLFSTNTSIEFLKYNEGGRPLHAKIVELHSDARTWVLSGSANAGNMAFGTNHYVWNDEACILLTHEGHYDYFDELGFTDKVQVISLEECRGIARPKQTPAEPTARKVAILSSELIEGALHVAFSSVGIAGRLIVLDGTMNEVASFDVETAAELIINLDEAKTDEQNLQMVVLKEENTEISNRCLVVRENDVEVGNPDPKRRKLTMFLNDADLETQLDQLLSFIEFDDAVIRKKLVSSSPSVTAKVGATDEDTSVSSEDYFNFKNYSSKQINEHNGIRVLETLKRLLYIEKDVVPSDESIASDNPDGGNDDPELDPIVNQGAPVGEKEEEPLSDEQKSDANFKKALQYTLTYLARVELFLRSKCDDKSAQIAGSMAMNNLPKLKLNPGLNVCTALNAALLSVNYIMRTNNNRIGSNDLKKLTMSVVNCASLFYAIYGFSLPDDDSLYSAKIRYLFRQNAIFLLVVLSYFSIINDAQRLLFTQTVLNCLSVWDCMPEERQHALKEYREERAKPTNGDTLPATAKRLDEIIAHYCKDAVPLHALKPFDHLNTIFVFRSGYGFLATNVRRTNTGWHFAYKHPRFGKLEVDLANVKSYKGFKDEEI